MVLVSPSHTERQKEVPVMAKQDNIDKLEKMGAQCIGNNDLSVFDDIWSADLVDHDPAPGQGPGGQGLQQFWSDFLAAFPDLTIEVDQMLATDELLSMAYRVSGTHDGDFMGVGPTGKPIEIRGLQMSRHADDGTILERWGSSDVLGILEQIGAVKV